MEAGKTHGLEPGHTSSIRRIEGGMLSYHADADINTNPYELNLGRLVNLDTNINFIGKDALRKINKDGIKRKQVAWYYESLYKEFSKHLKGHKVLKGNYLTVVKEIKRASSK